MPYEGVLKTEYVENKIKPLSEKIKKIFELLVAVIIVIVLLVVVAFILIGLFQWFMKEVLGVGI